MYKINMELANRKFLFLMVTLFTFSIIDMVKTHKCNIDKINKEIEKEVFQVPMKNKRFLAETSWTPINIYVDYTTLNSQVAKYGQDLVTNLKAVMEQTVGAYKSLLSVKSLGANIVVGKCGDTKGVVISNDIKTSGVLADLIIFPFIDEGDDKTTEAYATYCSRDNISNRPVAGLIGFSKFSDFTKTNAKYYFTMLALHEINHILSFNSALFDKFIDSAGNDIPESKVVGSAVVNGMTRSMIITPKVLAAAKTYFNCQTVTGVELEDQGGDGTAGSHWESRIMLGDFMIGETYPENVISDISLALMEDSGWYKVNYYTGGLFRYGKNDGCDFLTTKCIMDQGKTKFPNEFSTQISAPMCYAGRSGRGESSLSKNLHITEANYQYWGNSNEGGYTNADFCPTAQSTDNDSVYFSSSCYIGTSKLPAAMGEITNGLNSCFISSLTPSNDNTVNDLKGSSRAICYPITCNSSSMTYSVTVGKQIATCPKAGGSIQVTGFDGNLNCPDFNLVCTSSVACTDVIDCINKKATTLSAKYDYTPNDSQNISTDYKDPTSGASTSSSSNSNADTQSSGSNYLGMIGKVFLVFLSLIIW
jgi:leishmanolysin